jgi:HAD superfamily hydrolase (TIGR01484 family)
MIIDKILKKWSHATKPLTATREGHVEEGFIVAVLADIDGSLLPQGHYIDARVASVLLELSHVIRVGVATGKPDDYARGLSVGMGFHWKFVSAEGGAVFLTLANDGPPPIWQRESFAGIGAEHLAQFRDIIELDALQGIFKLKGVTTTYRNELKSGIITMFPPDHNLSATEAWEEWFRELVTKHQLELSIKRYPGDGAIDIVPQGIDKSLGVKRVCAALNCNPRQILTVCDGANDHELAEGTRVIAVANAASAIKEIAQRQGDFIATRNDGFGFVEGLAHYARAGLFGPTNSSRILEIVTRHFPTI